MRSDLLSKRFFFGGLFGLPWLWIVHVLYFRGNQQSEEGLLNNPDDHFQDEARTNNGSEPEMSLEEIKQAAASWVSKCQTCAAIFLTLWIGWIVAAQVLRNAGILPSSWFILNPDNAELTGW
ncbi:hypothetical protein ACA910_016881 [Epithemia clementina (nom. ined.)]